MKNGPCDEDYEDALRSLIGAGVIGLPTETVYGLAGDATNPLALRRIFELKKRPLDHPLIVHLGDAAWLPEYALTVPELARRLAKRFWPGPLTLILERNSKIPREATGGLDTVALRVPAHPVASKLLSLFGRPLAAPSANLFGRVSPTRASHVVSDFGSSVPVVLDGGPCQVGVESTILDVRGEPRLLRPGGLTRSEIEIFLGVPVAVGPDSTEPVRAPGTLASHYAPRAPLEVISVAEIETRARRVNEAHTRIGIFAPGFSIDSMALIGSFERWAQESDTSVCAYRGRLRARPTVEAIVLTTLEAPGDIAQALYAALRSLDASGCDEIWAVVPDSRTLGEAVEDRLKRAATPRE